MLLKAGSRFLRADGLTPSQLLLSTIYPKHLTSVRPTTRSMAMSRSIRYGHRKELRVRIFQAMYSSLSMAEPAMSLLGLVSPLQELQMLTAISLLTPFLSDGTVFARTTKVTDVSGLQIRRSWLVMTEMSMLFSTWKTSRQSSMTL